MIRFDSSFLSDLYPTYHLSYLDQMGKFGRLGDSARGSLVKGLETSALIHSSLCLTAGAVV